MNDRAAPTGDSLIVYADGAARGNPGPAAIGAVVLAPDGTVLAEISQLIGTATNNVAEYRALIAGLSAALAMGAQQVSVRMDSELVVRQLQGMYRVKHPGLAPLHQEAVMLLRRFGSYDIMHVPRTQNRIADALANRALDHRGRSAPG